MKIQSKDIPQADRLHDVLRTVHAVVEGHTSDSQISEYIDKGARQGRYYRRAAEILGFISNSRNHSELSARGHRLVSTGLEVENPLLVQAVIQTRVFQRLFTYIESHPGVSRWKIEGFVQDVTESTKGTTPKRRTSTLLSWLETIGAIEEEDDHYTITNKILDQMDALEVSNNEPLSPEAPRLVDYSAVERMAKEAKETIVHYIEEAKIERATAAHERLVLLVAEHIRATGSIPRYNQYVDLAARINGQDFIFEMKSTTNDNVSSQLRKALSQLYEYRYLQQMPDARLVIVIENPIPKEKSWYRKYIEEDRGVDIIWNGDSTLHCSQQRKHHLPFI